jgi:excisionase family DNA binding protein
MAEQAPLETSETRAPADTPWRTVKEAAAHARVGVKVIYREIRAGRLRAAVVGGRRDYRVHVSWIDEWLERSAKPVDVRALRKVRR